MDHWFNGSKVCWFDGCVESSIDRWFDGCLESSMDRWFDGSMDRWFDGSLVRWIVGRWFVGSMDCCFDGSLVRWFVGSMNKMCVGSLVLWIYRHIETHTRMIRYLR